MTDFVSGVKTVPHSDACIFTLLSDLSNLERLRERIPQDKVRDFTFDKDSCSLTIDSIGAIRFQIVERDPNKTIKFITTNSPIAVTLWIQLQPAADDNKDSANLRVTVRAELSPLVAGMVSAPLQNGVDKMAELLATLPYSQL